MQSLATFVIVVILDEIQIYETAGQADDILLIARVLTPAQLQSFQHLAAGFGMASLVEVHDEDDLARALEAGATIIGINNRDLNTFNIDLSTTERLKPLIPADRIVVSESGIRNRADIQKLREWGINAALIGEALMSAPDIASKMKDLL